MLREFKKSSVLRDHIRDYENLKEGEKSLEELERLARRWVEKRRLDWTRDQMTRQLAGGNALPLVGDSPRAKGKRERWQERFGQTVVDPEG